MSELIIKQLLDAWSSKIKQAEQLFDKLGSGVPDQLIVPGGNGVLYLTGHLTVVNDKLLEGMKLEERLCPEWDELFMQPFDPQVNYPASQIVREKWDAIKEALDRHFAQITVTQWLSPHYYVSEADFAKEPQRNLLNLLITRTNHLANHNGQLLLVKIG